MGGIFLNIYAFNGKMAEIIGNKENIYQNLQYYIKKITIQSTKS